jgi:hypothetical protein
MEGHRNLRKVATNPERREDMIRRGLVLCLILLILCLGPAGCFGGRSPADQEETGSVKISISNPEAGTAGSARSLSGVQPYSGGMSLTQAEVSLTNGTTVLSQSVTLENGQAEITFSDVVVGPWTVIVRLKDTEGNVAYEGSCRTAITAGQMAEASVVLQPALGTLELSVDLTGIPDHERVQRLRLYKDSNNLRSQTNINREPGVDVLVATVSGLQPKTHYMMIKLFDENGDLAYESLWEEIQILPGTTTTVSWDFLPGDVSIIVDFNEPPSPPTNLAVALSEDEVVLTWNESIDSDLIGYNVYRRQPPFEGFKVIAEVQHSQGAGQQSFIDAGTKTGVTYSYIVTAVDGCGNESSRSNEVTVSVP